MPKQPAFQFYPGDWMKDPMLRRCSIAARGLWIDLLCLMHEMPTRGALRDEDGAAWSIPDAACAVTGGSEELVQELIDKKVLRVAERSRVLFSARMIRERSINNKKRWNGYHGGEAKANAKQNRGKPPSKTLAKPKQKRGSSSSSSTSVKEPPKPPAKRGAVSAWVDALWAVATPLARERSSRQEVEEKARRLGSKRPSIEVAVGAYERWKQCDEWRKDDGEYVPALHRWIQRRKWEDAPAAKASTRPEIDDLSPQQRASLEAETRRLHPELVNDPTGTDRFRQAMTQTLKAQQKGNDS